MFPVVVDGQKKRKRASGLAMSKEKRKLLVITIVGFSGDAFLVFGQLMLDYHIGAASIARSLASYVVSIFELFPFFRNNIPGWIGHGGQEFFGGTLSINILAPILLAILTLILYWVLVSLQLSTRSR